MRTLAILRLDAFPELSSRPRRPPSLSLGNGRRSRTTCSGPDSQCPTDEIDLEPVIVRAEDAMPRPRVDHELEVLVRGLECLDQPHRIANRDVVVNLAVNDQELTMQVAGRL